MTPADNPETGTPRRTPVEEADRKRRLARIFGEVLPEGARDERGDAWGDREGNAEDWLRRQVPPHHG